MHVRSSGPDCSVLEGGDHSGYAGFDELSVWNT